MRLWQLLVCFTLLGAVGTLAGHRQILGAVFFAGWFAISFYLFATCSRSYWTSPEYFETRVRLESLRWMPPGEVER